MKRVRSSDTVAGVAQAFIDAAKGLPDPLPHEPISAEVKPYWEAIVALRPRDEWTEPMLVQAAQLARLQASIRKWTDQVEAEGDVFVDDRTGKATANPLHALIHSAAQRQMAYLRSMGLGGNDKTTDRKSAQTLRAAREAAARAKAHGLLA